MEDEEDEDKDAAMVEAHEVRLEGEEEVVKIYPGLTVEEDELESSPKNTRKENEENDGSY